MGLGVMIGWQWFIKDMISIDLNVFGIGIENDAVNLDLTCDDVDVDYEKWEPEVESEIKELFFIGDKIDVDFESNKIKVKASPLVIPTFRFGLTIGFAF